LKDTLAHISNRVPARLADNALKVSATFWFLTAVIGLWIFVIYIVKKNKEDTHFKNVAKQALCPKL
jgi:hypothetical protein